MGIALPASVDPERSGPELVTSPAVAPISPEQIPLIRMLELVRDRVDSLHAGQCFLTGELREIRASLPLQRKPLSKRAQEIHIRVIAIRRNGICPCCQTEPVCNESGRCETAEYDHWYSRNQTASRKLG